MAARRGKNNVATHLLAMFARATRGVVRALSDGDVCLVSTRTRMRIPLGRRFQIIPPRRAAPRRTL